MTTTDHRTEGTTTMSQTTATQTLEKMRSQFRFTTAEITTLQKRIRENEAIWGPECRPELRNRLYRLMERASTIDDRINALAYAIRTADEWQTIADEQARTGHGSADLVAARTATERDALARKFETITFASI